MTLRRQLVFRFVTAVFAILLVAMLSIYFFTAYFLQKNFERRLANRAETVVVWLSETIDNKGNMALLQRLLSARKDVLPFEEIQIFNLQNQQIFSYNNETFKEIDNKLLNEIRLKGRKDFSIGNLNAIGLLYRTTSQRYMVIALAQNEYGLRFLTQLKYIMLGILFVSVIIILIVGWFFSRKTLEPIEKIGNELNHIFPQNLNYRLNDIDSKNEIGQLSRIINQLLDRVEDGMKSQQMFIANVSHELKNPLTKISSQLEVSLLNERSQKDYQKTIQSVLEDTTNLIDLTQNLLKLSQSNADNKNLLVDKVRIDDVVWEIHRILTKSNPKYKININFSALPEDPEYLCIVGNHSLIQTALLNIVENACKFSADNQAFITLSVSPKHKVIYVKDNGKGINQDEIDKIFMPFYRSEKTANIKGYGIGLSLVDRIIKIHKGKIEINSQINKGTVFKISFE